MFIKLIQAIILISEIFSTVICSVGDRSPVYQKCLKICVGTNCLEGGKSFSSKSRLQQDIWSFALQWSCQDECSYHCMWHTVTKFEEAGEDIPKFHGKWPFVKFLGIQEPAAAVTSLLNLAANAYMYGKIRREFPLKSSVLAMFWHIFAFICMNAWLWSTIFHTRDKPFTEFMDYACALSMVMGLYISAVVRLLLKWRKTVALILIVTLIYFTNHVQYLHNGRINYDYNMKVNVFFGVLGSLVWLAWSWQQTARGRRHARSMLAFTALSGAALSLELLDFPPLWRTWDAHALWHLATAPLPLLFYKFVIDDLRFLQSGQYEKFDFKLT